MTKSASYNEQMIFNRGRRLAALIKKLPPLPKFEKATNLFNKDGSMRIEGAGASRRPMTEAFIWDHFRRTVDGELYGSPLYERAYRDACEQVLTLRAGLINDAPVAKEPQGEVVSAPPQEH